MQAERESQARERITEDRAESFSLPIAPEAAIEENDDTENMLALEEEMRMLFSVMDEATEPPSYCEAESCAIESEEPTQEAELLTSILDGLEQIGQGADPASLWLSEHVEYLADNLLQFSYECSPTVSQAVISALVRTGELVEASFGLLDEATERVVSQTWNSLDDSARNRIKGGEKVVSSVLLPLSLSKKAVESTVNTARKARPAPLNNDPYHPKK